MYITHHYDNHPDFSYQIKPRAADWFGISAQVKQCLYSEQVKPQMSLWILLKCYECHWMLVRRTWVSVILESSNGSAFRHFQFTPKELRCCSCPEILYSCWPLRGPHSAPQRFLSTGSRLGHQLSAVVPFRLCSLNSEQKQSLTYIASLVGSAYSSRLLGRQPPWKQLDVELFPVSWRFKHSLPLGGSVF